MGTRGKLWFKAVGYGLLFLAALGLLLRVLERTLHGHGADLYRGGRGLYFSNVGVLITFIFVAVALLVGLIIRWRSNRIGKQ